MTGYLDNLVGDINSPGSKNAVGDSDIHGLKKLRDDYHALYTAYYEETKKLLAVEDKNAALRSKTFPGFLKGYLKKPQGSFVWDNELRKILIKPSNKKFREKVFIPNK